jgi:hypothetical protein
MMNRGQFLVGPAGTGGILEPREQACRVRVRGVGTIPIEGGRHRFRRRGQAMKNVFRAIKAKAGTRKGVQVKNLAGKKAGGNEGKGRQDRKTEMVIKAWLRQSGNKIGRSRV